MEIKDMVGVGQASLSAVVEGVAKVRDAIPEDTLARADDALAKDSLIGKQVLALVTAAAERSEHARERAAEAAATAKERAVEVAAVAKEKSVEVAEVAREAAEESVRKVGSGRKFLVGAVLVGAAAAAGYMVYKRRQGSVADELSGEPTWAAATPPEPEFQPGVADLDSPDVVDDEFAREIDAVADQIAEDFVEAVEGEHVRAAEAAVADVAEEAAATVEGAAETVGEAAADAGEAVTDAAEGAADAVEESQDK